MEASCLPLVASPSLVSALAFAVVEGNHPSFVKVAYPYLPSAAIASFEVLTVAERISLHMHCKQLHFEVEQPFVVAVGASFPYRLEFVLGEQGLDIHLEISLVFSLLICSRQVVVHRKQSTS